MLVVWCYSESIPVKCDLRGRRRPGTGLLLLLLMGHCVQKSEDQALHLAVTSATMDDKQRLRMMHLLVSYGASVQATNKVRTRPPSPGSQLSES